ncbi:pyridoxal kinase-like isoform X2 [Uloborus diversus]|uniref:pyridoxal kinase-like isoform X2 n=1 Tax=Uloborus diversus TaxID=327109 RepID=UPI00240A2FC0|nr:pyridoxal kinase-like isoform X2 [Uloborus diversus]
MERNCEFERRVLSIQSHVVSGYVGNKSAIFPLQVLGFEVDYINSVQLSNHTGYKHIKGQRLNADELFELYEGLRLNNLLFYSHLLTGYIGTATFLKELVNIVKQLKEINPNLYYVCDPVLGDNNELYVPEELLPIYRNDVIPLADLITPNQFEAELLTGVAIKTKEDAIEAINILHKSGVKTVVLSSVELGTKENLTLLGSSLNGDEKTLISLTFPKMSAVFTGSGDLFSALLLAWMSKTNRNLKISCEKALNTMQSVLKRTIDSKSGPSNLGSPFEMELKIVQSKNDIENPPSTLKCQEL